MSATLLLLTIPASHYCEKARWALQRAGLAFHEEGHAPGFSRRATGRMGKASSVPFLLGPTGTVASSTEIVRFADTTLGQRQHLFPDSAEVDRLVLRFDAALGPHARRLAYSFLLPERALAVEILGRGIPGWERVVVSLLYPLGRRYLERAMRIDAEGVTRSRARVQEVFDEVGAMLADGRKYLVGERFSAADLTFASLAGLLLLPPQYGGRLPPLDRWPVPVQAEVERLRATPAGAWALRIYAEERGRSATAL